MISKKVQPIFKNYQLLMHQHINYDIFYGDKTSLIELFHVERSRGKVVISFIQERTNYESIMDPDDKNNIIYTVQSVPTNIQ